MMRDVIPRLFDNVYVISLSRSKDRRAHIAAHFAGIELADYSFFDAVDQDGAEVAEAYARGEVHVYPPCFRCGRESCGQENCNNVLIAPQVAVYLTYLRLWREIAARPQRALVVEDDVLFQPDAAATLVRVTEAIAAGEVAWEPHLPRLLRLGWALGPEHCVGVPFRLLPDVRMSNPCHALTSAYAQALLDRHERIATTPDIYMHQLAPREGEALTVLPPVASELSWSRGAFASLIHPKPIRTEYLREHGDEQAAQANERLVRDHRAHAAPGCVFPLSGQPKL